MRPSTLVPSAALRAVDRVRTRRFLATTGPATVEYVRRNGLQVRHGPFEGMRYLEGFERTSGDLVAKLTGSYERSWTGPWESGSRPARSTSSMSAAPRATTPSGSHTRSPSTTVHAFDIDASARSRCARLAELNGVADRVLLGGECTAASLGELPEQGVVLLSDCEGAERAILDPELAPRLRGWPILVELHDFIDPTITETIVARFEPTHEIEMIPGQDRAGDLLPELDFMTPRQRAAVLSERRPGPMSWASTCALADERRRSVRQLLRADLPRGARARLLPSCGRGPPPPLRPAHRDHQQRR